MVTLASVSRHKPGQRGGKFPLAYVTMWFPPDSGSARDTVCADTQGAARNHCSRMPWLSPPEKVVFALEIPCVEGALPSFYGIRRKGRGPGGSQCLPDKFRSWIRLWADPGDIELLSLRILVDFLLKHKIPRNLDFWSLLKGGRFMLGPQHLCSQIGSHSLCPSPSPVSFLGFPTC